MKFKEKTTIPPKYILLAMTIICLVLLLLSLLFDNVLTPLRYITGYTITPMQSGLNDVGLWVNKKIDNLQDIDALMNENEELKAKLDEYSSESKAYQQDMYELERLRDLYKLDEQYPSYEKVGARVIAKDSDNWFNVFVIDKGSEDGIQVNSNVLAGNGLAGIVIEVGPNYSKVRAVIDDSTYIGAMAVTDSSLCIVNGDLKTMNDGYIKVTNIDKSSTINEGDEIATSQVSDKYLPGITIGYISDIQMDSNNLTMSGKLTPVVDFKNLQEVLVIKEIKQKVDE